MNNPKISVVMPNYNCARFLRESIESVLAQTFSDFEFIIIDDGSTDDSWEIILDQAKKDNRIKVVRNEKNLKICETLNRGIDMAKGEYIARMDSDDTANPNWLETVFNFMEKPENEEVGVCGANFFLIDENGKKIGEKKFPETDDDCRKSFWFRNPFGHNTVLIRKKCFLDFGGYDKNFIYAEDLELWMRFGQKYKFYNIQEYLVKYRISGENSVLKRQKKMIKSTLKARRMAFGEYDYAITLKGRLNFIITWLALFVPSRIVFWVFNYSKKYIDRSKDKYYQLCYKFNEKQCVKNRLHPKVWDPSYITLNCTNKNIKLTLKRLNIKKFNVLDVGCGYKPYKKLFQTDEYVGVDFFNNKRAEIKHDLNEKIKLTKKFDVVLCLDVMEHIKKTENLTETLLCNLKKDGILMISIPFAYGIHGSPHDYVRFTRNYFLDFNKDELELVSLVETNSYLSSLVLHINNLIFYFPIPYVLKQPLFFISNVIVTIIDVIVEKVDNLIKNKKVHDLLYNAPFGYFIVYRKIN